MSTTTDEIPQQPHITVPETAPTAEPTTTAQATDQPANNAPEQQTNTTTDVTMSEAPVEVNQTTPAPQPETAAEKPAEKPVETPIATAVKEDSVKEELSAGKKKKKNKANLQEKLKQLNEKLNMLNALNKKIESKTGVASSPVLLPLATPALPAQSSLALSGTGEDELSDSKKRKTRPNTLYDDYEIDATSRPLKKIGVPVGASPPPMMPQYVAPTTPTPVAPKKAHTPRGRGRPVGRPRGSGQHATYAQPGTYEPEWDEDYEDYEGDNDFDSFAPKGVGRPPKAKRPPRPQPRPVVPVVPYTPVAATLTPPPGRKRRTGQYLPLSAPLQQCAQIATALMKHPMSPPFNIPVDPLALGIPDYWTIIKEPMDLGTIKSWVDGGAYKDIHEFADDVRLVWRNALTYNAPGSQISVMAQTLADFFEQKFTALINRINNPEAVQSSPVAVEPVVSASPQPAVVQRVEVDPAVLQRRKEMQETLNDLRGLLRSLDKQVTELKKQTANLPQPPSAKPKARSTRASATRPPPKRRPRDLNLKPMSYEEKCKLSDDINSLSSEHWAGVMAVIEEEMPQALKNDTDEVELDIDTLDIVTLRRLEAFIAECQGKPAVVTVTQAPTAAPVVPSPPVPPREPKVKKPKDDEAKQKPKRQPRKKTGPPQSITEETIRETERQLKAVNQSLTTGNASLKNIGDLESKQQSNKEALTRPKKGSHSSSSSDSSDSSDTDSDSSDDGSGEEGVKKKKKDKHQSTGGKAPMTSKATEGEVASEETAAPKILTPTSPLKKEVVLQNVESWTALDESKPEEGDSNSTGPNNDSLWSEFRTKGQQNKQRMKEREDLEEKQRLEREKKERELKEEEERLKREQREKQEEEERKRMEEMQRRREQERLMREQQSGQAGPESSNESAQSTILQSMTEQSEMLHSFEHQLMGHGMDTDNKLPLKPVDDEEL